MSLIVDKDEERRIRLLYKGNEVFRLFSKRVGKTGDEMIVKPAEKGVRSHYSLVGTPGGLMSHIKHERPGGNHTYDQRKCVSVLDLLRLTGAAMAFEDDPPPAMLKGTDAEKMAEFSSWAGRNLPRVIHAPTSRNVHIPTESGFEFIEKVIKLSQEFKSDSDKQELDLTDLATEFSSEARVEGTTIVIKENEMQTSGHTIALSEDESRLIILLDEHTVVEFSSQAIQSASADLLEITGLLAYLGQVEDLPQCPDFD